MSNIVLIDDQQLVKIFLSEEMISNGHSVVVIDDPDKALSSVLYLDPDLVVLNVLFNNLEGWNLLQEIKTTRPSLPVLIFSIFDCLSSDHRSEIADAQIITDFKLDRMTRSINCLLKKGDGDGT